MLFEVNDIVVLKDNSQNLTIPINTLGTIIELLTTQPSGVYKVEFIDENGKQIDCLTLNEHQISFHQNQNTRNISK